jgi:hypothetical protein
MKGVFEKIPGSGVWQIRYADATGKIRYEKDGTWGMAKDLYYRRKTEISQGRKLPERLRARKILFSELTNDVLRYLETHNDRALSRNFRTDPCRI